MNRDKKKIDWNKRWEILSLKINNMKEINWTKVKSGDRFTAVIGIAEPVKSKGVIHKSAEGLIWLCQNEKDGGKSPDRHGYKYSWYISKGHKANIEYHYDVRNLKIISQTKKPMAKKQTFEERYKNTILVKKPMKTTSKKKSPATKPTTEKIKTLTGANWHIAQEKKGFSTKLVAKNGKVNRYDKGFNNRQNAMTNITSSVRNGFVDDGIFIEAMIAAKTRQDVVDAISAYGYLKPKRVAAKKKVTKKKSVKKKPIMGVLSKIKA